MLEVAGSVNGQAGTLKSVVEQIIGQLITTAGQTGDPRGEKRPA